LRSKRARKARESSGRPAAENQVHRRSRLEGLERDRVGDEARYLVGLGRSDSGAFQSADEAVSLTQSRDKLDGGPLGRVEQRLDRIGGGEPAARVRAERERRDRKGTGLGELPLRKGRCRRGRDRLERRPEPPGAAAEG
jgi:hypothetical protein